jgi:hypothetical protein
MTVAELRAALDRYDPNSPVQLQVWEPTGERGVVTAYQAEGFRVGEVHQYGHTPLVELSGRRVLAEANGASRAGTCTPGNCPFHPQAAGWAMGPEGWEQTRRTHETSHLPATRGAAGLGRASGGAGVVRT